MESNFKEFIYPINPMIARALAVRCVRVGESGEGGRGFRTKTGFRTKKNEIPNISV